MVIRRILVVNSQEIVDENPRRGLVPVIARGTFQVEPKIFPRTTLASPRVERLEVGHQYGVLQSPSGRCQEIYMLSDLVLQLHEQAR